VHNTLEAFRLGSFLRRIRDSKAPNPAFSKKAAELLKPVFRLSKKFHWRGVFSFCSVSFGQGKENEMTQKVIRQWNDYFDLNESMYFS